jgi:hypothetical protein
MTLTTTDASFNSNGIVCSPGTDYVDGYVATGETITPGAPAVYTGTDEEYNASADGDNPSGFVCENQTQAAEDLRAALTAGQRFLVGRTVGQAFMALVADAQTLVKNDLLKAAADSWEKWTATADGTAPSAQEARATYIGDGETTTGLTYVLAKWGVA